MSGLLESLKLMYAHDATVLAGIESGSVRGIPLTQGKIAIVDVEDYEWLTQRKWLARKCDGIFYASRGIKKNGRTYAVLMHRELLGLVRGDGNLGDHKNHNSLDNRRSNLRVATTSLNSFNCKMRCNNTSGYRGVNQRKQNKIQNYQCHITVNGKLKFIGCFATAIEAAKAYDIEAIKYRGENAVLNFPERGKYV